MTVKKGRGGKNNFPNAQMKMLEQDEDKRQIIGKSLNNILVFREIGMDPVKNDEELCERLNWFFTTCAQTNQLPTVEKMCVCLGYVRQHVFEMEVGNRPGFSPATRDIIKKAKEIISSLDAELALDSKIQPVVYMFRAKNYYGMSDKQEYVITPNQPLGDYQDATTIEEKYKELPED